MKGLTIELPNRHGEVPDARRQAVRWIRKATRSAQFQNVIVCVVSTTSQQLNNATAHAVRWMHLPITLFRRPWRAKSIVWWLNAGPSWSTFVGSQTDSQHATDASSAQRTLEILCTWRAWCWTQWAGCLDVEWLVRRDGEAR